MTRLASRMPLIDALKAIASQLIVLHHLASYGPVAEAMNRLMPTLNSWLFDYGRMAVQVFLVIGGFLAARALTTNGLPQVASPLSVSWRRYQRLVPSFMVAMLIAIAAAAMAKLWWADDAIPGEPSLWQFLAHGTLLHGVFGFESLSAGVWYVAIDLQLFVMLACLLWLSARLGSGIGTASIWAMLLVGSVGAMSLLHFNRLSEWDAWGVYFFGSYALGAAAYWASGRGRSLLRMLLIAAVVAIALIVEFRLRIALAASMALLLAGARRTGMLEGWPNFRIMAWLGKVSYSVFLIHFPIVLLVNAAYFRLEPNGALSGLVAVIFAWACSIAAGAVFHRYVELRERWLPAPLAALPAMLVAAIRRRAADPKIPEQV